MVCKKIMLFFIFTIFSQKTCRGMDQPAPNGNPIYSCNRPSAANSSPYPQKKIAPKSIRLFNYNIRYLHTDDKTTENEWRKRLPRILTLLKHYQPDILTIQEPYPDEKQIFDLIDSLKDFQFISYGEHSGLTPENYRSFYSSQKPIEEFMAVAFKKVRFSENKSGCFWPSEHKNIYSKPSNSWDAKNPRIVIWSELFDKTTKKLFTAATSHFDGKPKSRFNSIPLIITTLKNLSGKKPFIFAGDCNFMPDQKPTGQDAYMQFIKRGMKDIRDLSKNHYGPDGTFMGFKYDPWHAQGKSIVTNRLDHMFVSDGIKVDRDGVIADRIDKTSDQIVLQSHKNNVVDTTGFMASDHAILATDISIS